MTPQERVAAAARIVRRTLDAVTETDVRAHLGADHDGGDVGRDVESIVRYVHLTEGVLPETVWDDDVPRDEGTSGGGG